ncbi:toll-like receptor 4 [Physella acuta]|uniref:toll-like receptor 4 n=1 Tax=Physella acuta TaxID=109671 RepID=UPI0027DDBF36|nr:toll-like receptor 4 [Physella acuta]
MEFSSTTATHLIFFLSNGLFMFTTNAVNYYDERKNAVFNHTNSELTWNNPGEIINESCPDQCLCFTYKMACRCYPNWPHVPSNTKRLSLTGIERVTIICAAVDNLNQLEYLRLDSFQGIDTCEKYFHAQSFSLRYLIIQDNIIAELPVNLFANLRNLAYLELRLNRLTLLQDGVFAGLTNLKELVIYEWYIHNVSDNSFAGLKLLTDLKYSYELLNRPLKKNSPGIISLTDFTTGSLDINPVSSLGCYPDKAFALLTSLQNLRLYGTDCKLGPGFKESDKFLRLHERKYNESKGIGLHRLEFLDLSYNRMIPRTFQGLYRLKTLNISHIEGTIYLRKKFNFLMSNLLRLEELRMSNLNFDQIHKNYTFPKSVKKIDLSYNQIRSFHSSTLTHLNLTYLNLSHNQLNGFTQEMANELQRLKSHNPEFLVDLQGNVFAFECANLPILYLLAESPEIFYEKENIFFATETSVKFNYTQMIEKLQGFSKMCQIKENFSYVLSVFFTHLLCLLVLVVFFHYRWKLRYLYFIGQRRLHIGGRVVNYNPQVDVFVTYDEGEPRVRRLLKDVILPFLREKNISYILGEVDFPGGDMVSHISGAITGTRKTLVLLSEDLFLDHYREYEMNLAIIREFNVQGQVIVPVFVERVDLNTYPPEVETYLRNQLYRCLVYRNNQTFWTLLLPAIKNDK